MAELFSKILATDEGVMADPFFKIPATDEEVLENLETTTRNAREAQLEMLRKILELNGRVEYLQRHGLNNRTDEASFKACLPVITYADIADDVDRIADGDRAPILCVDRSTSFSLSSGTTGGKSKMIPRTDNSMSQVIKAGKIGSLFRRRAFPRKREGKPVVMAFQYAGRQFETKSGLKAGTATTNIYRSPAFKNTKLMPFVSASPTDVVLGFDVQQQMYCHLLCGLYRSQDVEEIGASFAYMIVEAFRLLERIWRDICTDIREGTVNERVSDPAICSSVQEILSPNLDLADSIERECGKGFSGIIERLFPNLLHISGVFSGSMLPYIAPMRYYAGSVPLIYSNYGSSEALAVAINIDPQCPVDKPTFTMMPDFAYYEFIPVNRDSMGSGYVEKEEDVVGLTDVKVGQEYEILLTTVAGLYRYRQGDIIRVTGFYNSTPQVAFVCRKGIILSVNTDKTDEEELQLVVGKASQLLLQADMELAEFSSYADHDSQPGHYVIFWELRSHEHLDMNVVDACCKVLDRSFNDPYMRGRAARTIGPLELAVVKEGAFGRLRNQFVGEKGVGQYKLPRCITNPVSLKLLRDETIATSRSPDFPPDVSAAWRPSAC